MENDFLSNFINGSDLGTGTDPGTDAVNVSRGTLTDEKPETKTVETAPKDQGISFAPEKNVQHISEKTPENTGIFSGSEDPFSLIESTLKSAGNTVSVGSDSAPITSGNKGVNIKDVVPPGMMRISVEIYVELLESMVSALGQWYSGTEKDYNFDKNYKKRYVDITEMYANTTDIYISPGQLFLIATLFLVFSPAKQAFMDRKNRLKAEMFRKKQESFFSEQEKNKASQLSLFEPEKNNDSEVKNNDILRRSYEVDQDGFFTKNPDGSYCKKDERKKCPDEILFFIKDFFQKNSRYPKQKEVQAYLKF